MSAIINANGLSEYRLFTGLNYQRYG